MHHEVIIAGFGGQGVMMIGQMLAYSGMDDGKQVTWLPSYGPEMRGGTAYCTVVVSDDPISSPVITNPEICIVMNRPSLEKFESKVREGGYLFINSSLIDTKSDRTDIKQILVSCNELAAKAGNPKSANVVMLGALVKETSIVSVEAVHGRIEYAFKRKGEKVVAVNKEAFGMGMGVVGC